MPVSKSVFSEDIFFVSGVSSLLSPELINNSYYILDVGSIESVDLSEIKNKMKKNKTIIAFIESDFEFYALSQLGDMVFIDKHSNVKNILTGLMVNNEQCHYRVRFKLSDREREMLNYILDGIPSSEIIELMGINERTFYVHRRNLIQKLRFHNRVEFYRLVSRMNLQSREQQKHKVFNRILRDS